MDQKNPCGFGYQMNPKQFGQHDLLEQVCLHHVGVLVVHLMTYPDLQGGWKVGLVGLSESWRLTAV